MNRIVLTTALTFAAATPLALHAQESPGAGKLNRFSFGATFGLNFKASFHNTAPALPGIPGANIGPAQGGVDHSYDDGYVNVDSSGNAGGRTWNWGYQNGSQVAGDTMQFHSLQSSPSTYADGKATDNPQYGAELLYQRILGTCSSMPTMRWGWEGGFGFTDLDLRDNRSGQGFISVTTDSYALNGVVPPGAGYNGTFQGPGPLLGDTPTRSVATDITTLASRQRLSGQVYTFRTGPFAEWDFAPRWSLTASAGLVLAPAAVDYDFTETYTSPGSVTVQSGHTSDTELLYGYYAGAKLGFELSEHWGLYLGAQFQSLNDMTQSIGTHRARFDAGATVTVAAGVSCSF